MEGGELGVLRGLRPAADALRPDCRARRRGPPDMVATQGASVSDLVDLLRPAGFGAHELPVDISELARLFAEHAEPAPLGTDGERLRHLILSRAAGEETQTMG